MPNYFAQPETLSPSKLERQTLRQQSQQSAKKENVRKLAAKRKPIPRGTKPIAKKNEKRQQRLAVVRRNKHAAYRRSDCYKAVEARSEGRCERMILTHTAGTSWQDDNQVLVRRRCPNRRSDGLKMVHNHKTYARYGGDELPEDMELLCPSCNSAYESEKRGNRRFKVKI